uniref:Uncharacterized protein n=1 Tax=Arundo donax TaxID=35708 RepID=A0A0A8ZP01_ARUDO
MTVMLHSVPYLHLGVLRFNFSLL